jgi:hypothetical protein
MKRLAVSLVFGLLLLAACQPKTPGEERIPGTTPAAVTVTDVKVETNDHRLTVSWKKSGSGAISGYNVYIGDTPGGGRPFNHEPFPGDTDPDDGVEHFVAEGLDNGVKYFVSVAVVHPDRSLSPRSTPIPVACGPRGEIELAVRYRGERAGYSFEKNTYVPSDNANNDLYFFSNDGLDMLASPSRLDGFLNHSRFLVLPYRGDFRSVADQVMQSPLKATEDRVSVSRGDWLLIQTAAGKNALVNVVSFAGEGDRRVVRMTFAYSTLVGEAFF